MYPLVRVSGIAPLLLFAVWFFLGWIFTTKGWSYDIYALLRCSSCYCPHHISSISSSISFLLVPAPYETPFSIPTAPIVPLGGVIHSSGQSCTSMRRSSCFTRHGNGCHVSIGSFLAFTYTLWNSPLNPTIWHYCLCKLGDNLGYWFTTICRSISMTTKKILFSVIHVSSFVNHIIAYFTDSHTSTSIVGNWESSSSFHAISAI